MDSQEPEKSNDLRFIALHCIVFELSAYKISMEISAVKAVKRFIIQEIIPRNKFEILKYF